ncbi:unnamed protein product [Ectocarpus sp. 8 AP-2014]
MNLAYRRDAPPERLPRRCNAEPTQLRTRAREATDTSPKSAPRRVHRCIVSSAACTLEKNSRSTNSSRLPSQPEFLRIIDKRPTPSVDPLGQPPPGMRGEPKPP